MNLLEERLLKILGRCVIVGVEKSEKVFEHTAGSTRSRHKLHNPPSLALLVVGPHFYIVFHLIGIDALDASAHGGSCFYLKEREACFKLFKLMIELLLAYPFLGKLL